MTSNRIDERGAPRNPAPRPNSDEPSPVVGRLVDRLLSTETTFFDHCRLKNLGRQPSSPPEKTDRSQTAKRILQGALAAAAAQGWPTAQAVPRPEAPTRPSDQAAATAQGWPTARAVPRPEEPTRPSDQAAAASASPSRQPQASPATTPDKLPGKANGGSESQAAQPAEAAQAVGPEAATPQAPKAADSRWLTVVKWLTRLFCSLLFLACFFALGVLVGRGSLFSESPARSVTAEETREPVFTDYPVVVELDFAAPELDRKTAGEARPRPAAPDAADSVESAQAEPTAEAAANAETAQLEQTAQPSQAAQGPTPRSTPAEEVDEVQSARQTAPPAAQTPPARSKPSTEPADDARTETAASAPSQTATREARPEPTAAAQASATA
ncbi:MAG: hypothetical protein LBU12_04830, partial [Deltaproteobacteria bacterium]|nr:hypothetical protein [Deltaproteobacteria bacterium]